MGHRQERIADDEIGAAHVQASAPRIEYLGLERYWRKLSDIG